MYRPQDDNRDHPVEERLDALLAAYRQAVPDPEPSAGFMPGLWDRIEARRAGTLSFRLLARRFVTAGAAICIVLGLLLIVPATPPSVFTTGSYLDALAADLGPEHSAYAEIQHPDGSADEVSR